MDIQRNLLTISLVAISAILWFKWVEFTGITEQSNAVPTEVVDTGVPAAPTQSATNTGVPSTPVADNNVSLPVVPETEVVANPDSLIVVDTDIVRAVINTKGGVIEGLELKNNPIAIDQPDQGFPLLKKTSAETYVAQDGLISGAGISSPNHQTQYLASGLVYELGDNDTVIVPLTWRSDSGVEFIKTYTFSRDSYVVDIDYRVNNQSDKPWAGYIYGQFNRSIPADSGGGFGRLPSYNGGVYYETAEEKRRKVDFDDMDDSNLDLDNQGGWVAMLQHYFVGAWLLDDEKNKYYTSVDKNNGLYRIGFRNATPVQVTIGQTGSIGTQVYLGSKEQARLKKLEDQGVKDLALTVDYGFLTFIADPLFTVLSWIHDIVGNWGWAIILLTILIKAAFYPLSAASYRSMGKMKKLQPRMATLKERYKDDRQKFIKKRK